MVKNPVTCVDDLTACSKTELEYTVPFTPSACVCFAPSAVVVQVREVAAVDVAQITAILGILAACRWAVLPSASTGASVAQVTCP